MLVELDSDFGKKIGFISEYFHKKSYIHIEENTVIISFICSNYPNKGNFKKMINRLLFLGYEIIIPTPINRMKNIVIKNNYKKSIIKDSLLGEVEIWTLKYEES